MEIVGKRTQQQSRNFESNLLYNGLSISENQKNIRIYPIRPVNSNSSERFISKISEKIGWFLRKKFRKRPPVKKFDPRVALISGEISGVFCLPRCLRHSHTVLPTSLWSTCPTSKTLATENWLSCYLPLRLTSNTISPNLRTHMNFHYYLGIQCQAEPSNLVVYSVLASRCPSCPIFLTLSHLLTKRITRSL